MSLKEYEERVPVKFSVKRAPTQRSKARDAKLTVKNVNANYETARTAALAVHVKLTVQDGVTVQEQLMAILSKNKIKLIDLFREWDDDGNGT